MTETASGTPLLSDSIQSLQNREVFQKRLVYIFLGFFIFCIILVGSLAAVRDKNNGNALLTDNIDVNEAFNILVSLNDIANQKDNNGSRAVALGYNASAAYIQSQLTEYTDLTFSIDPFDVPISTEYQQPYLQRLGNNPAAYCYGTDYLSMDYSANGSSVQPAYFPILNLTGCNPTDYNNFPQGNIAIVLRGICSFYDKAVVAAGVGASAIIIYNDATNQGLFSARCGGDTPTQLCPIPALSTPYKLGNDIINLLISQPNSVTLDLRVYRNTFTASTFNVIADTKDGNPDQTVVIGSHLDSVVAGPGINDNGSGSALNLYLAILFKRLSIKPKNRVRFAWWGAEELGLWGSKHYVQNLKTNDPKALSQIAANLNYDMIGSPNAVRGVYNGSSDVAVPGSGIIQKIFADYFDGLGNAYVLGAFDGRSDYAPFMSEGIPAGGVFTGAEVKKTPDQKTLFGGLAYVAYDPCYHQSCDTTSNIDMTTFEEMMLAASHAAQTLFDADDLHSFLWPNTDLQAKQVIQAKFSEMQPLTPLIEANHKWHQTASF